MTALSSFGNWLMQRRKVLDLTQEDLADQVGCSTATIQKIEADTRRPSKQIAERLADVLAISQDERTAFVAFARRLQISPPPPALQSLPATHHHNLPPHPTMFIGRVDELAQIAGHLADPACRLLTLVGVGGIGKTRLALQAAEQVGHFADGVYFVALAPVDSANALVSTMGSALKFTFYGQDDPKIQLFNHLRGREMLLVIDNFEHLLDGAGLLAELLANAPRVKILATSRERLNLLEEWVLLIDGLSFPVTDQSSGVERYSAVQLFAQCAKRVQSRFTLAEHQAAVIAICQQVEGMPLGIELAATWLRVMPSHQIAEQIKHSLDFLATPLRNVPERHRSLRAVFDHSWALLSDTERAELGKLAVFRGGFDMEAAAQVACATFPVLGSLCDKSLLRADVSGRYNLHEQLRQYAVEKLIGTGEAEATHRLHLEYFLDLAEQAETQYFGPRRVAWNNRLDVEHDNLRAALGWSLTDGDAEVGLCLAGALGWFWRERCYRIEGRAWLEKFLAVGHRAPVSARAKALHRAGELSCWLGDSMNAIWFCEASLSLARQVADKLTIAWSLGTLGTVAGYQNDHVKSAALLEEALALFRDSGDKWATTIMLSRLGKASTYQGNYERATALYEEALSLAREADDKPLIAYQYLGLGNIIRCQRNSPGRAIALYHESLSIFRAAQEKMGIAETLVMLAALARSEDKHEQAETFCAEGLALSEEIGYTRAIVYCLAELGGLARIRQRAQQAARLLGAAKSHYAEFGQLYLIDRTEFDRDVAAVRARLGEVAFSASWAAGQLMTLEQAVPYALNELAQIMGNTVHEMD